ncbi:TetR/AcrR family transcriptional regulator [Nakamurella endophytica]|uniref:TetR family transcriptional regulator n=1 Tax=Nakamurella endophytica TaxID=1748367 RepID=A0A917SVE2_9ACTN|nr:TetR/AcrR family transcriptional regulator [Nakamurella endophytica]GGL98391.1 TetR family transcriptional regulator [Nakamurella endophytica]
MTLSPDAEPVDGSPDLDAVEQQSAGPSRLGRGEQARRRIRRAALEVLADDGMPGFTMEAVARRAGAGKATLYRHWPSASALLVEAMDAEFRPLDQVDTGDLRVDLVTQLTAFTRMLTAAAFPRLMAAFVDAAERDPALAAMHTELTDRRRDVLLRTVAGGVARGDLPADVDSELVVDLLVGPFFYRRFVAHRPITADLPEAVVDQVLAGLRRSPTGGAAGENSGSR